MHKVAMFVCSVVVLFGCSSSDSGTGSTGDSAVDGTASDTAGSDAKTDGAKSDTAGGACGDKTCTAGQICTRTHTSGGACLSCGDDAAACPTGSHCGGTCCTPDTISYSYACKDVPTACVAGISCGDACGNALCSGGCPCESVAADFVTCHCLAP